MSNVARDGFSAAESLARMDGRDPDGRWLTPASIGLSLVLVGLLAYFLPYLYLKLNLRAQSGQYLPVVAVFPALLLIALNGLLRRIGIGLRQGEVTVVLCSLMMGASTLITVMLLFTSLPSPIRAANPQNNYSGMFLWSIDNRLLPYNLADKEREASAGQFDENLNWYYMGVPKPLKGLEAAADAAEPAKEPASGPPSATSEPKATTAAASSAKSAAAKLAEAYDPSKLKIPWWRWVRAQEQASADASRNLAVPWFLWTGPLVWWLILLMLFVVLQFCLAAILRRQWVDHEKLLFPQVELLEAVTAPGAGGTPGGGVFRNRLMWIGFAASVLLYANVGLHAYFPAVPGLELDKFSLSPLLTSHPWNAIPGTLNIHMFIIAIAFLLPAEISMSLWVFVLIDFALRVNLQAAGYTYHTTEPVTGYLINGGTKQLTGLTVFILALMYAARRHWLGVVKKAFFMRSGVDDSQEPMGYATAFWCLVLSLMGVVVWCYIMGMSPLLSILLFGFAILAIMFLARVVCELGIVTSAYQETEMPQYLLAGTLGYHAKAGSFLFMTPTFATWAFLWPALYYGTNVMPMAMTVDRMCTQTRSRRWFTSLMLVVTLGAMGVFAWRAISVPYEEGAVKLKQGSQGEKSAGHAFNNCLIRDFIQKDAIHKPFAPVYAPAIGGVVVMTVLLTLRHLFFWWPLHPIGFICTGLSEGVWFSVFIGWLIKRSVLKYGGGQLFRKAIPLFVGLLVGHIVIAGIWMIVGSVAEAYQGQVMYSAIWWQP